MITLDLLSQVLFVTLMAMFLYVLYRRFVAMMLQGRISGDYARVVSCRRSAPGMAEVRLDMPAPGVCTVRWEGGDPVELSLAKGEQTVEVNLGQASPDQMQFDFGNQQVVRRVES